MIHQKLLANGLQILGEVNASRKSCALGFFVNTGARDEQDHESGLSHFLEHMLFKGTEKRSALDLTFDLGNIGAKANAYTSEETTVYYSAVLTEYFEPMLEILSDMLRPTFVQDEFDTEKKVILEEIALYQDRPHFYLFENAIRDYYQDHPAGNSVLGSVESINGITRDEMQQYFDRRYVPGNMVLVATGNFDWQQFVEQTEAYCGHWSKGECFRDTPPYPAVSRNQSFVKKELNLAQLLFLTEGASATSEHRYSLGLLASLIGDSSGSRLYWDLIDTGLAESAGADNDEKAGTGNFLAYASTTPDRLDEVADRMRAILNTPTVFTEEDLERIKTKVITRMVLGGELPTGRLMSIGNAWTYRSTFHELRRELEKIRSVSKADILAAIEEFPLQTWSEYRLVPG